MRHYVHAMGLLDIFRRKPETAIDPVCHMTVEVKGARFTSEHEGVTYYFCGRGCRLEFEDDPQRFFEPGYRPSM